MANYCSNIDICNYCIAYCFLICIISVDTSYVEREICLTVNKKGQAKRVRQDNSTINREFNGFS